MDVVLVEDHPPRTLSGWCESHWLPLQARNSVLILPIYKGTLWMASGMLHYDCRAHLIIYSMADGIPSPWKVSKTNFFFVCQQLDLQMVAQLIMILANIDPKLTDELVGHTYMGMLVAPPSPLRNSFLPSANTIY